MRREFLLPGLAVAGGAVGFALRRWQWAAAYDGRRQLFQPAAATYVLLGFIALLALLFLLLSRGGTPPEDFLPAFFCPSSAHMAGMAAAGFLFLGAGGLGLLEGMEQLSLWRSHSDAMPVTYPAALTLCAVLCLPAGAASLLLGRAAYRGSLSTAACMLAPFPAFAGLVWLFTSHLNHGTDPVLMGYGISLAATALLMLAHYDVAAFLFGRRHPWRALFCSLLGAALGLISLADSPSRFTALLTAAFVLSALTQSRALLRSRFGPPRPQPLPKERMPLGAEDEDREDDGLF